MTLAAQLCVAVPIYATTCEQSGTWLQVLGSGGPELSDQRASTSYLIWHNGKARVMVDAGGGSMLNFEKTGADFNDIGVIVFSHLHLDHAADFPAYIKSSFFTNRKTDLIILGPDGNHLLPAIDTFVTRLIGTDGAWPYLSNHLNPASDSYQIKPLPLATDIDNVTQLYNVDGLSITGIPVHHGPLPAVGWRIDIDETSVVFSGDMSNERQNLHKLAVDADLLVAHNVIPEEASGLARRLHMPPSEIGRIANQAAVAQVVLSHRMQRTLGREKATLENIKKSYKGPVKFADDMDCFAVGKFVKP